MKFETFQVLTSNAFGALKTKFCFQNDEFAHCAQDLELARWRRKLANWRVVCDSVQKCLNEILHKKGA